MYTVLYKVSFIKQYNKLEIDLQEEVLNKLELLKDKSKHSILKVHKLHGELSGKHSFYVNYKIRVVFIFNSTNTISILGIGSHDIYR